MYVLAGLISGTGLGLNQGQGVKLGQANSGKYVIGLIFLDSQLSPSSINLVPAEGWEGNHRSGASCGTDNSGITTHTGSWP